MNSTVRICELTGERYFVSPLELKLREKLQVPLPRLSPLERMRRLTAFNNFTNLYKGRCAATGEPIVQAYRPDVPFPVYAVQEWWSERWDPFSFGRQYDFSRPMFEQFSELLNSVPHPALQMTYSTVQNCDYVNGVSFAKNCYLLFNSNQSEDCMYSLTAQGCTDCIDCSSVVSCQLCFDCTVADNCYELKHSFNCNGCRNSAFLWNCIGCDECFGCINLRRARHCYFNEQLSPEAYRERIAAHRLDDYRVVEELWERLIALAHKHPQPAHRGHHNENITGDYLLHCSDVENGFDGYELRDCVNVLKVRTSTDCLDQYTWGTGSELVFNSCRVGVDCQRVTCCYHASFGCDNVEYSFFCKGCRNCFGCVALRGREHCIFNVQYSPSEYKELRGRIVAQMNSSAPADQYGEFFPYWLSRFPYNDSDAMLYFPISRQRAATLGARWSDDLEEPLGVPTADWSTIPNRTAEVTDDLTNLALRSTSSGKLFRLTAKEFRAYKERNLPIPRLHWRERLLNRQALINPPVLNLYRSAKSGKPIETTFVPEDGWSVWENDQFTNAFG